jgi:hypothetical protein
MADYTNRVDIDISFLQGVDGNKQLAVAFSPQEPSYSGYANIATSIFSGYPLETFYGIPISFIKEITSFGTTDYLVDIGVYDYIDFYIDKQVQYSVNTLLVSGTIDDLVDFRVFGIFSPAYRPIITQYVAGRSFLKAINIVTSFISLSGTNTQRDIITNYTNYTGYDDFYAIPLPAWSEAYDIETIYTVGSGVSTGWGHLVEVYFAGWVSYNTTFDIYCSNLHNLGVPVDFDIIPGQKLGLKTSCYSSLLDVKYTTCDIYGSELSIIYLNSDVGLIKGDKYGINTDITSSYEYFAGTFDLDVNLFPIYFDDFSLLVSEYSGISNPICLDAHDGLYTLVASGTYLKINDTLVETILTPVDKGYRLCYIPDSTFYNSSGVVKFTAHAENNHGDMLEEDFYLTFGYIVEFDNKINDGLNYGFNNKVSVRIEAENLTSCPSSTKEGYYFISEERLNRNLSASIICYGAVEHGNNNLSATIYPHSTAYFYDKEMRVVLTARDFNGNEMDPFVLEFKIKNDS